jgi:hypothetical protein
MCRSELVQKLLWSVIDTATKVAMTRQRKHPRRTQARDGWMPLLGGARAFVQRQVRIDDRVCPVTLEKITDLFTAACKACGCTIFGTWHRAGCRNWASMTWSECRSPAIAASA